jgi:deferrochelatase/peroxidase EfeB/predicted lipoprotein with Yx(FWY)xxD motif
VVNARLVGSLGQALVDPNGKTLYLFVPDQRRRVACTGTCPGTWPPLLLAPEGVPTATGAVNRRLLGVIPNPDGGRQVTYNGWPLYTYVGDLAPGEANGNGLDLDGGLWYAMTPAGLRAGGVELSARPDARRASTATASAGASPVPFYGAHQAGVETAPPAHVVFAAYDLTGTDIRVLRRLLRTWTVAAAELTAGKPVGEVSGGAGPPDSGEATGRGPASLTVTVGFGPAMFDDRFGLAAHRPPGLVPLPSFRGDRLDPAICGGDLMVQACAEDAMVAFHAVRQLTRLSAGTARVRWMQRGFGASAAEHAARTPRNLFGQKDGTDNPVPGTLGFASTVWVDGAGQPSWMRGGTYLCVRRIRMDLDRWDATPLQTQEAVIGRAKGSGAPLSGGAEHSAPDFAGRRGDGSFVIPADSHVRLSHPAFNAGAAMYRRGYSYDNGYDSSAARYDAGLLFLAFVADVDRQFVPVQAKLAGHDALNAFTAHVGSAVFAVPPGTPPGGYLGQSLFAAAG